MKKIRYLVFILLCLLLVGCGKEKKVKTCTMVSDQSESGYKITTTYDIYAKNKVVVRVEEVDEVTSKEKSILDFYEKEYNGIYKKYNKTYNGYSFDIKTKNDSVSANIIVDYNKLDRKKYVKDNTGLKKFVNKDNYFTVDGIVKMYENLGAICKNVGKKK